MKFLSNIKDPGIATSEGLIIPCSIFETFEQAIDRHNQWIKDKIIGKPMPSNECTVNNLEEMGFVGVYLPDITKD